MWLLSCSREGRHLSPLMCGWVSDWWRLQESKQPASMCVQQTERATASLKLAQRTTLWLITEGCTSIGWMNSDEEKGHMGNIRHSLICTVSTKQQRKTSPFAHVFSFLLLTAPRSAPPLVPPQKTAPRRMCGFWAFDRVKPVRGAGGTEGGTTLLFKARSVIPEAWTCAASRLWTGRERERDTEGGGGRRNGAGLVLSRKSVELSDRSEF